MDSLRLVEWMIAAMVVSTALLVGITVGLKVLRDLKNFLHKRCRQHIEPALEEFLITNEKGPELMRLKPRGQDFFLSSLMVERMALLRGADRERLARLAEELGLVRRYLGDLGSRRRWRRARAAENLGFFGDEKAVEPLGALLSDEDETVRAVAARAMARIGTEGAARVLARTLDDPSELTRLRAAENLERLGDLAVGPLSATVLDLETEGAAMAAEVLGNLRNRKARPALGSTLLHARNAEVRAKATLALGKIGDPDDVPFLLKSAACDSWPVRVQAANSLGLVGESSTIPVLKKLAADPEWWVRLNACKALVNMGPSGEKALLQVLKSGDRDAREHAAAVLEDHGVTLRAVRNLAKSGGKSEKAKALIRAVIRSGSTRYLRGLVETLPDGAERQSLEGLLEENVRLQGSTPTDLWRRRLRRTLSRTREEA